jgi:cation:H+ antiporter
VPVAAGRGTGSTNRTREAFVGRLFIAITTSLPEIVVSFAAVRIGALDLGIDNVLGSNLFNLLILGARGHDILLAAVS